MKGKTIARYMSSVRAVHIYEGYSSAALKDVGRSCDWRSKNQILGGCERGEVGDDSNLIREFNTF